MANNWTFKSNVPAFMQVYNRAFAAALEAIGMLFTSLSMDEMDRLIYHAPLPPSAKNNPRYKRTGRLRSGQGYEVRLTKNCTIVYNNVEYAVHVHFPGITRNYVGKPWMTNTINERQNELRDAVVAVFRQAFGN